MSLDADTASIVSAGIGAAADVTGLTAQEVAASAAAASFGVISGGLAAAAGAVAADIPPVGSAAGAAAGLGVAAGGAGALTGTTTTEAVALGAQIAGAAATVAGVTSDGIARDRNQDIKDLTDYVVGTGTGGPSPGLPFCELTFTGTVTVDAGGVNVTGASIFNDDVGIDGNLAISGEFSANQVNTFQGISAHGGAIFLGNPDGVSFFDGITLGGGALGGAGFGGATAFTGDVSAIAIGNGARAELENSIAFGTGAGVTGIGGIAVGFNAATTTGVSIGNGAGLAGDAGVAVGTGARARETNDAAYGNNSTVNAANGAAFGANSNITSLSDNGVAIGENTTIGGANAVGSDNVTAVGRNIDIVDGVDNAVAVGTEANVLADGGIAIGQVSAANVADSIAIGRGVNTDGVRGVGIGFGANADGTESTAIGANSSAGFANSAAFGANATVTRSNQQKFGTASNTYTMPGITSSASKASQSGLVEIATSDAAGNLATDGGAVFNGLARVQAGVAVAMAIETPELASGEKFGIRLGWGGFDSFESDANAVGASAIGVLGRNLLFEGDRLAMDAGIGWGYSEFQGYKQSGVLAGRAGMQLTW